MSSLSEAISAAPTEEDVVNLINDNFCTSEFVLRYSMNPFFSSLQLNQTDPTQFIWMPSSFSVNSGDALHITEEILLAKSVPASSKMCLAKLSPSLATSESCLHNLEMNALSNDP